LSSASAKKSDMPSGSAEALAENRAFRRRQFYITDGAKCAVTTEHGMVAAFIIDLDPRGLKLAVAQRADWHRFTEGHEVEVVIESPTAISSDPIPAKVRYIGQLTNNHGEFLRVGLQLMPSGASALARSRASGFTAYRCPEFFRPIAFCPSPFFLNEMIHFQVAAIKSNGLVALTSLRNQGLFPGMALALRMMIPNLGEYQVTVRVLEVRTEPGASHTSVEMALVDPEPELQAGLGEFVMSFAKDTTIRTLHDQGFFLDTIYRAIRVTTPANEGDWQAICALRLRAYHSVGKFQDKTKPDDTIDPFDKYSRQIIARVGDRVVGAARVVFCGTDLNRSEHNALGIKIPDFIVAAGFVEFSRFCTDPDFRGGDLFVALMRQASLITLTSKMPYIVANCNSDLWEVYRKLGFYTGSDKFEAFGRKDCRLVYCDPQKTILGGKGSGLIMWNQTLLPIAKFAALGNRRSWRNWHPWIALQLLVDRLISRKRLGRNHQRFSRRKSTPATEFKGTRPTLSRLQRVPEPPPT